MSKLFIFYQHFLFHNLLHGIKVPRQCFLIEDVFEGTPAGTHLQDQETLPRHLLTVLARN